MMSSEAVSVGCGRGLSVACGCTAPMGQLPDRVITANIYTDILMYRSQSGPHGDPQTHTYNFVHTAMMHITHLNVVNSSGWFKRSLFVHEIAFHEPFQQISAASDTNV